MLESKIAKQKVVCTMKPLRQCIERNQGDLTRCHKEIKQFEATCDKRLHYVHDRDGLDDTRSGLIALRDMARLLCASRVLSGVSPVARRNK